MYNINLGNITMPVKLSKKKILENNFMRGIKTIIKFKVAENNLENK